MNAIKHAREFLRAIRTNKFEVAESGIFLPAQKLFIGGAFEIRRNKGPWEVSANLMPLEGRLYMLNAALTGGLASNAGYVVPFATNVAPGDTLTAATFNSVLTEFTNYTESTRQAWTLATINSGSGSVATNVASPATITIGSGGQTAVYGAGINMGASAKSASTGTVLCATLATVAKTGLTAGETLGFRYALTLAST